jgi:hypothetical protein
MNLGRSAFDSGSVTSAGGRPLLLRPSLLRSLGEYSWEWLLEPTEAGARLLNRVRATRHPWTRRMIYEVVAANGDIVMTRKMLRWINNVPSVRRPATRPGRRDS